MIKVDFTEAKAGLSRLLRAASAGEAVVICERDVPVAELRPIAPPRQKKRKLGPTRPGFELPASFFDPLPEQLARAFAGEDR